MHKITLTSIMLLSLTSVIVAEDTGAKPAAGVTKPAPAATPEATPATEAAKPEPEKTPPAPVADEDPDVAARRETSYPVDGDEWKEYALGILEMEMQEAVDDLSHGKPKPPALVTQPRILSRLDLMIEELEKKCNGGKGSNNAGNKPADKSVLRKGKMKEGEMRDVRKEGDRWADIPAKEREKILQSQGAGFPPGYEDVLADYFRKLSKNEKPKPALPVDSDPGQAPPSVDNK
jgi:hypothetical protein